MAKTKVFFKNTKSRASEPSGEERAFVYQQAIELSPFLLNKEPVGVILEKNQKKQKPQYSVTFILVPETLKIEIQSEGDNLFDVCINAKNKAIKACRTLAHQLPAPGRKQQLAYLKKFPWVH